MIKGFFFDFDGVITIEKSGTYTIVSYLSQYLGLPYDTVLKAYSKYNNAMLIGEISHADMWSQFCSDLGTSLERRVLEDSFLNVSIDRNIINIITRLKQTHYTGIITDNKEDRVRTILSRKDLSALFDDVIISSVVHAQKNSKHIFEEALRASGLSPSESVFIDNTPRNLEIPCKMGFHTIYFDDTKRDYLSLQETISQLCPDTIPT